MWHYNTKVWTSRAEGAIWDKASIGDVQKRKVITVDVLLDIVSKHIQTHFSDLLKALYSLSQCYTGWYLSRNSGMVWIICIFTAWEHTGAGDLLVIIMLDQTQFSPLPVTLAFFFLIFKLQTPQLSQKVDKDIPQLHYVSTKPTSLCPLLLSLYCLMYMLPLKTSVVPHWTWECLLLTTGHLPCA